MNVQKPGIEWTHVFGMGTGRTWNPVGGCEHECRWDMPDGQVAICYAELIANKFSTAYPQGFDHHYWRGDAVLSEPLKHKKPLGIFLDSMSDLMGHWVPEDQINQVLDICKQTPQHVYMLLTKNAPRLLQFKFPANVWVGVSVPPTQMFGKKLTENAQVAMLERSLKVLAKVEADVRWMSIEPLSWDVAPIIERSVVKLQWAIVGAATHGPRVYQPKPEHVRRVVKVLDDMQAAVFYKGNLRHNAAAAEWREEFPQVVNRG
jgi:protein gp37